MALKKTHKRKKGTRFHGKNMGTCGTGARKNKRKSGNKGGIGMAGTGKRADHKKTLVQKLYGNDYFGKQGITSRGTKRDTRQRINVVQIEADMKTFIKKGLVKEGKIIELNLKKHIILGNGEISIAVKVTCKRASKTAIEKINAAGGEVVLPQIPEKKVKKDKDSKEDKKEVKGKSNKDSKEDKKEVKAPKKEAKEESK